MDFQPILVANLDCQTSKSFRDCFVAYISNMIGNYIFIVLLKADIEILSLRYGFANHFGGPLPINGLSVIG